MLFKKSENQSAYLKAGIMGFAGSGKSRTSTEIAIGLHKLIKSNKPVFFLDTETGSDFLKLIYDKNNIELFVFKSRAFKDLIESVKEAEKENAILIIDSVSHFWTELMESFQRKYKVDRLLFHHWGPIKQEWRTFTDLYVNSNCHIIMAGRAGFEYDMQKDDEGYSELVKTGTKMKAETEMGYEPSLLIEMEKIKRLNGSSKIGGNFLHRAWILKDRFDTINGQSFDNPTFKDFLPHINLLNIGGNHHGFDSERNSEDVLADKDWSSYQQKKQKEIMIEELKNELLLRFNSRSEQGKKDSINKLNEIFRSSSMTAIEGLDLIALKEGLDKVKAIPLSEKETKQKEESKKGAKK